MSIINDIDLTPITRLEYDIDAILNDHAVAEPITRIELILADIVAGNTTTVVPVTRIETFLAIISGADYPAPEPVTRIETFLAIIAGEDYEEPEAVTRLEGLLAEWVEKGSGIWKTVTGTLIHITDALASPVKELSVAIEPQQSGSGDPSPTNVRPIAGWTGCNIYRSGADTSSPTTYPISWETEAGTVYGGTLTVNEDGSADLVSKWVQDTFPSNSVVNNSGTSASGGTWCSYRHVLSGANKSYGNTPTNGDNNGLFNIGKWRQGAEAGKCRACTITNGAELYCTLVSDQYDLRTSQGRTDYYTNVLGEAVPTVCYKLATPITYHLDSISQITTLVGENNIWTDVNGEITLTYLAKG